MNSSFPPLPFPASVSDVQFYLSTYPSVSNNNSPIERNRIDSIDLEVLREHLPNLFLSIIDFSDINTFIRVIEPNASVSIELITKLLELKKNNPRTFQQACSLLHTIYTPINTKKVKVAFLQSDSSSDDENDDAEMTIERNKIIIRCVYEMI
jgi:hypothetical protein